MDEYFKKLYAHGKDEFYKLVEEKLESNEKMFIVTANAETFMAGTKNREFDALLKNTDTTIIPDGISIVTLANRFNYRVKERITGVDLTTRILEVCDEKHYRLALLGATEEVIEKLQVVLREKYPNIKVVAFENGYILDKDSFFERIKNKDVDVCLVALGIPEQEKLIYKHLDKFKKGIFIGVGGTFDVISGAKKRAPKIFIKMNLEWLYRLIKEPRRIARFFKNNVMFMLTAKKYMRGTKNEK